ncbi:MULTISPECIES: putative nitrogen fixation protein NifT [unclassified Salipiger]|uniref:putative nitrogen fixation protein NifT n=1 Tax=unclassified Salipiger TaxID=2640570 RepID=UPI00080ABAF7|nr:MULTISPECIES: putative nitrogen fixation protein NifT [unclassified Salipiger]ANT58943.1 nitrogen fixation protein FixU [Salipiger sp. CCB-MM3]NDV99376.1 putative nitrogen fixation protein NifT [Salipiger sp. PrR002]NDW55862.1 putative nitrogen fixation protein NifT [Salipiger sp. PrR004]
MKVIIRETPKGLEAYVPKKDLEEMVVETENEGLWGGWARLSNGWVFAMPAFDEPPRLPITVDARRLTTAEEE